MGFTNTGWSYAGSSGGSGSVSFDAAEITAGQARITVSDPDGNSYKIIGTGVGIGVGASLIPASATYSGSSFPSTGTDIYGLGSSPISIDDLSCLMVIYSASALGFTYGGSGSVAFFINPGTMQKISIAAAVLTPVGPLGILATLTGSFKAVCCFTGTEVCLPQLGVDATGTAYWISSADLQ